MALASAKASEGKSNGKRVGVAPEVFYSRLLALGTELMTSGDPEKALPSFVVSAAELLGFARALIALREGDSYPVRWAAEGGSSRPLQLALRSRLVQRLFASGQPFWTDDASQSPDADLSASPFPAKQYLLAPLMGVEGEALGVLAVLDRLDGGLISEDDVASARVLAAQAALVIEAWQNLRLASRHQAHSEHLTTLARELSSSFRLPDFLKDLTARVGAMLGARNTVLALDQGRQLGVTSYQGLGEVPDRNLMRRLNSALTDFAASRPQPVASAPAADLLGAALASSLGWTDLSVARLAGPENELLGLLCLANRGPLLTDLERTLLQAVAGHAAVALDNSRLFSRIEHSNRQWMEIFDAITDFIVVHDENHRVLRVNRSLAEFIGVHPAELIGVTMRALVSIATEAGATPCPFCRSGPEADEFLHPVLERTYLVSTSRTQGAFHDGQQVIHVLKDISDRREAERRYQELFDNIQEGLFFSTPEGRFIEVNDALVRMLGYASREHLLQVSIPGDLDLFPDQRRRFAEAIEKTGALRNFEETLRRQDGSPIHTLQNAVAVRDAQGRVVQYRGVILDITELKTFQSQLQRERDFNSMILNNTQSMILVADTAGYISFANRRCYEAAGYRDGELLGQSLDRFVAPERRSRLAEALASTLRGQPVHNLELPFLRGDGKTSRFSVSLSLMRDEERKSSSIVAVMTDVTDAALLQAKLMHTEKMAAVGQLVSGVAHEVNNPLTAILGFADLLVDQPDLPEHARQDLRLIVQEAQRTRMIVQNLLSFARQMPPQRKPVQVNSVLRRTLQLRAYDFASHGVEVVEDLGEMLPEIVGDSHQLQQVFLNILNNAYDAVRETGRRGRIEIQSGRENGSVVVAFCDNGNGITAPDRIFDPFFTTKEVGKGTGLGLSICYGIVREHGGEITCENRRDSSGAVFRVKLPLASEPAMTEASGDALKGISLGPVPAGPLE